MQFRLLSEKRKRELGHDLQCTGIRGWDVTGYTKLALLLSLIASSLFTYALSSFVEQAYIPLLFVLFFVILFLVTLRIPKMLAKRRALLIEADLPIQLRALSTELAIGVPFENALESSVRFGDYTKDIFKGILTDLRSGVLPQEAFNRARSSASSSMLDKALSHLAFLYSYGYEGSGLGKLVDEISAEHRSRVKEFASMSSVMGVVLIALTSVVPALATTYILVGSSFMDISLTPSDIHIIYIVVLPIITLSILLGMRVMSPPVSRRGVDFLSHEELKKFTIFLGRYGININAGRFLMYLVACSVIVSAALYLFTSSPLSFLAILLPLFVYGLFLYLDDMRISAIEERMPDALFYAASLHTFGLERVISEIAKTDYGPLSEEFRRADMQVGAGLPVRVALKSIVDRNPSPIVERGISLLVKIHEVGSSLEKALKSSAEDIHDMFLLLRERGAVLSMQKYNLMLASLLVPAIFGAVLSLVSTLDLSYLEELLAAPSSRLLLPAVQFSINVYFLEFSLLSSVFLADYSGSWKRFAVYLVFLLPIVFFIFYTVQALL